MISTPYNAHDLAAALVRPGARLLDVGCGPGRFAALAAPMGCRITGIDIEPANVAAFREAGHDGFVVDLEDPQSLAVIEGEQYDQIALLDVLEHTRQPAEVLARVCKHLAPGGEVIVSIPNVTHLDVRLALVRGEFRYAQEGLLDQTHLRFFDRAGLESMLGGAGLTVLDVLEVHRAPSPDVVEGLAPGLVEAVGAAGDATVYQWVMLAALDGHDRVPTVTRRFLADALGWAEALADATGYARGLEARVAQLEEDLLDALHLEREVAGQRVVIGAIGSKADEAEHRLAELHRIHEVREAKYASAPYRALDRVVAWLDRHRVVRGVAKAGFNGIKKVRRALMPGPGA